MLFALVVMAGVLLLTMVFNNRRRPARWEGGSAGDGSPWVYGGADGGGDGGDSGSGCGGDAGGGDCGGGDGGGGGGGD